MTSKETIRGFRAIVGVLLILPWLWSGTLADSSATPLTPEPPQRPVVLLDYYHHSDPQMRIGELITTGAYKDNLGRYGLDDFHHTNSFDPLVQALSNDYALVRHNQPLSSQFLEHADMVFIFTPDSRSIAPDTPLISDEEIDTLDAYVKNGGGLLLMVNSYHPTEKFDQTQMRKLFHRFGLDWNDDDTKYVDIQVPSNNPWFYDLETIHYGAGCTLDITSGADGEVMLEVHGAPGDEDVRGPGIVRVQHGQGAVIAVGDTGSWGANMDRAWADNDNAILQIMGWLKRDTGIRPAQYEHTGPLSYAMSAARVRVIPTKNTLNDIAQPHFKLFVPREKTQIPYLEFYGSLTMRSGERKSDSAANLLDLVVDSMRHFDQTISLPSEPNITISTNRLGSIIDVEYDDPTLAWMAAESPALLTFVPNHGVRVGDRWTKSQPIPIPPVQGTDIPTTVNIDTQMTYVGNVEVDGKDCRLFETTAWPFLTDIGIDVDDLLPDSVSRSFDGNRYSLRGGRLLLKRQQWIDMDTGIVRKVRTQSRVIAWINDSKNPGGNTVADQDNKTLMVASQDVWFRLEE